jgi:hypothetical protein
MVVSPRPTSPHIYRSVELGAVAYHADLEGMWDDLVARSRNGQFMVTRRFLDYHGGRFLDRSLLFTRRGKAVAAIPLHEEGAEWISHRGLPFGGLIAAPELSVEQTLAIFREIGSRMHSGGIANLRYTPTPNVYQSQPFEDDLYALHLFGARLDSMKLAARARLPRIGLLQLRVRKYLRQAVSRIRVEHGVPLAEFWEGLTRYLRHRHGAAPVHTESEMADLLGRFPEAIRLLGVRDAGRRLVAGSVVFLTERVIRFQYAFGAGDPAAPKQCLLALDESAIKKFGPGRAWLDFGTSMRPTDGTLDLRLHAQKERCGGRGMRVETWVWDGHGQ